MVFEGQVISMPEKHYLKLVGASLFSLVYDTFQPGCHSQFFYTLIYFLTVHTNFFPLCWSPYKKCSLKGRQQILFHLWCDVRLVDISST